MSMPATIQKNHVLDGKTYSEQQSLAANKSQTADLAAVPAAYASTLTTHTTNTSGTLTLPSGHNVQTGNLVDIYWAAGGVNYCAYGCTVGTVSGNSVPITAVTGGTALPASSTAVTVAICQQVPFPITGNNLVALLMTWVGANGAAGQGSFTFVDGSGDLLLNKQLTQNTISEWYTQSPAANPLAGDTVAQVYMSHSVTTGTQNMRVGILTN